MSPFSYHSCCLFLRLSSFFFNFFWKHRIFYIHVLLIFMEQLRDCFWWTFNDLEKEISCNNPAWKVVRITWSLALSTYSSSLLNWVMYCFSDSPFTCWMLKRWLVGFLCLCPLMKCWTKPLLSYSKSTIVLGGILLNHTLAAPFSVVGNALHITSFGVIYNSISILNDSMWSKGSLEPSYDSNYGR